MSRSLRFGHAPAVRRLFAVLAVLAGALLSTGEAVAQMKLKKVTRPVALPASDLRVQFLSAPSGGSPGQDLASAIRFRVYNDGPAAVGPFNVDVVLATSPNVPVEYLPWSIDYAPIALLRGGRVTIESLAGHASREGTFHTAELLASYPNPNLNVTSDRYLGLIVDSDKRINESNESNNVAVRSFTLRLPAPEIVLLRVYVAQEKLNVDVGNRSEIALDAAARVSLQLQLYCPSGPRVAGFVTPNHWPSSDQDFRQPHGSSTLVIGPDSEYYCSGQVTIFPKLLCWQPPGTPEKCTHYPTLPSWTVNLP